MKKQFVLFEDKKECCGCGICSVVCPKQAIQMAADEAGFVYPKIQDEKCISCQLCKKVCAFQQQIENNVPKAIYALAKKDKISLLKSASGGVFAGIAEKWIDEGGIVYGAALIQKEKTLIPCHVRAQTRNELLPILGSKYVQSDVGEKYLEIKKYLENGRNVLFSGTPCQIAGLNKWLGKKYQNLLTIDLVCHGVPNAKMFRDYLEIEQEKIGQHIEDFRFRDKENGWGLNAKILYNVESNQLKTVVSSNESSYYELFLRAEIYRENCYYCPFANENHPADLTIGDYWGIEIEHPDYLRPHGMLDPKTGISMLMINSDKGTEVFEKYKEVFYYYPSIIEKISRHNEQLNHPSIPGINRQKIMRIYKKKGYRAVDTWYWNKKRRDNFRERVKYQLHRKFPIRTIVKKVLGRK